MANIETKTSAMLMPLRPEISSSRSSSDGRSPIVAGRALRPAASLLNLSEGNSQRQLPTLPRPEQSSNRSKAPTKRAKGHEKEARSNNGLPDQLQGHKFLQRKSQTVVAPATLRKPRKSVLGEALKQQQRAFEARRRAYLKLRAGQRQEEHESQLQQQATSEEARAQRLIALRMERVKRVLADIAPSMDVEQVAAKELLREDMRLERKQRARRSRMAARRLKQKLEKVRVPVLTTCF